MNKIVEANKWGKRERENTFILYVCLNNRIGTQLKLRKKLRTASPLIKIYIWVRDRSIFCLREGWGGGGRKVVDILEGNHMVFRADQSSLTEYWRGTIKNWLPINRQWWEIMRNYRALRRDKVNFNRDTTKNLQTPPPATWIRRITAVCEAFPIIRK